MNKRYTFIMLLSFIYGGYLLTSYSITLYSVFVKEDIPGPLGVFVNEGVPGAHAPRGQIGSNTTSSQNVSNTSETNNETRQRVNGTNFRIMGFERRIDPMEAITAPFMLLSLIGGIICLTNGLAIRQLTHEKEIKKVRADLADLYLSAEEKQIMDELNKAGGELTQKNLTDLTGYSRVKTHRIVQKLESKKLIRKIPNGQTNKILIETGQKRQNEEI